MNILKEISTSLFRLDGTGKHLQESAVSCLNRALTKMNDSLTCLNKQVGIGANFGTDKIEELQNSVEKYKNSVKSL